MNTLTYDYSETVVDYRDNTPGFESAALVEMSVGAGEDCADVYVEGDGAGTTVRLSEDELVALIEAAERALAAVRANA